MSDARRPIRALPTLLVNQIAAGEVVERPASAVKELVENSIDAGATRIRVELEDGGLSLLRVSDDGCGIPPEELALALAPHATSKLAEAGDLSRIGTMGFRGEALASIASVSRLTLVSRTRDRDEGARIDAEGDGFSAIRPEGAPPGTTVTVRTLFFNTPARRAFLRTPHTEQTRCVDVVEDAAIAHPAIAFAVVADGRTLLDLPKDQSPRRRALDVLGAELADQVLEVHADHTDTAGSAAMWGLVGRPAIARATNRAQHVFVNGRPIRDRAIQHALKEAFRGLIDPNRHPTAVLMIEIDPASVDVNVHPTKSEVRFRDGSMIHSMVLRAVRESLQRADLTPTLDAARGGLGREMLPSSAIEPTSFVDYFRRAAPTVDAPALTIPPAREPAAPPPIVRDVAGPPLPLAPAALATRALQIHDSYLVAQDDHGLVIIDQHALHERVMFEQLLARIAGGNLESQRLLTPAVTPASASQLEQLESLRPLLARIGIDAEPFGPNAIAVHAFPSFLFSRRVDPIEFMTELLEHADAQGFAPGDEASLHEVLDMMACKAAVKAGDALSELELSELLGLREAVERSSSCPHGRPTSIRVTLTDLEKLFHRR